MRDLKVGFCILDENDKVLSKVVDNWHMDDQYESSLLNEFNVDPKKEISFMIAERMKLDLNQELLYKMITEALK